MFVKPTLTPTAAPTAILEDGKGAMGQLYDCIRQFVEQEWWKEMFKRSRCAAEIARKDTSNVICHLVYVSNNYTFQCFYSTPTLIGNHSFVFVLRATEQVKVLSEGRSFAFVAGVVDQVNGALWILTPYIRCHLKQIRVIGNPRPKEGVANEGEGAGSTIYCTSRTPHQSCH